MIPCKPYNLYHDALKNQNYLTEEVSYIHQFTKATTNLVG